MPSRRSPPATSTSTLAAASARGIAVTNTPDVLTEATADVAMLCLLGAARRAFEGQSMVRAGRWRGWTPTQLLGLELNGAMLGIVGMGRIGQAVARRARAFGMHVHYHARRRLTPELELGAVPSDAANSAPGCRFLSLHCPATAETARMINSDTLARLPPGAVLINTARGVLLDDEAVLAAWTVAGCSPSASMSTMASRIAPRLPHPAQLLPSAAPRQRHRRDSQRHGLSLSRQRGCGPGRRPAPDALN